MAVSVSRCHPWGTLNVLGSVARLGVCWCGVGVKAISGLNDIWIEETGEQGGNDGAKCPLC